MTRKEQFLWVLQTLLLADLKNLSGAHRITAAAVQVPDYCLEVAPNFQPAEWAEAFALFGRLKLAQTAHAERWRPEWLPEQLEIRF